LRRYTAEKWQTMVGALNMVSTLAECSPLTVSEAGGGPAARGPLRAIATSLPPYFLP